MESAEEEHKKYKKKSETGQNRFRENLLPEPMPLVISNILRKISNRFKRCSFPLTLLKEDMSCAEEDHKMYKKKSNTGKNKCRENLRPEPIPFVVSSIGREISNHSKVVEKKHEKLDNLSERQDIQLHNG